MSDNNFKLPDDFKIPNFGDALRNIKLNANIDDLARRAQPDLSNIYKINDELNKQMEEAFEEKRKKEEQRDEWLRTIAENVLAIKSNSDKLVLSVDDLIETIVVSNNITESNMLIIDEQLQRIIENGKVNVIDEIKKATVALATQKGLEVGFVFLLKSLGIL